MAESNFWDDLERLALILVHFPSDFPLTIYLSKYLLLHPSHLPGNRLIIIELKSQDFYNLYFKILKLQTSVTLLRQEFLCRAVTTVRWSSSSLRWITPRTPQYILSAPSRIKRPLTLIIILYYNNFWIYCGIFYYHWLLFYLTSRLRIPPLLPS